MIQIALITGRSDPHSCALNPVQERFLARFALPNVRVVSVNYPYYSDPPPHHPVALIAASLRNGLQFAVSRVRAVSTRRRAVITNLVGTSSHTVFIAGSCGLELLASAQLPPAVLLRTSVFAYGPVALNAPGCKLFTVRGRKDFLSRAFFPRVDQIVDCGHYNYLSTAEVLDHCQSFVANAMRADATTI